MFDDVDKSILMAIADFAAITLVNARSVNCINDLAVIDDLTGLYNLRHFGQLIESEFL